MSSFHEANQVRQALKMKLSQHAWYISSVVLTADDGYSILVKVKQVDNKVRKEIHPVIDGVSIKAESE